MSGRNTFKDNPSYIIREICESTNIPYASAFKGICSEKTAGKYKNGEKIFDIFTLTTIVERLGFSPDKFEIIVPDKVHDFFLWHNKCLDHIEKNDWRRLEKEVNDFCSLSLINDRIQTSYRDYFNYILERYYNKNMETAHEHIKHALLATGICLDEISVKNSLLSVFEWHLLINFCDMEILLKPDRKIEISEKLYEIYLHKIKNTVDDDLMGRVIPKIALFILNKAQEIFPLDKRLGIEKHTIKIMVKASVILELPDILKFFIEDVESSCEEDIYIRQWGAVKQIFRYLDIKTFYSVSNLSRHRRRYVILSDFLRIKRKELGLTCEEVSEGICSVENYQRIEHGKIFPSSKNLALLANRLGMGFTFIRGDIEADSHKTFLLAAECSKLVATKKFKSVKERLLKLKEDIDLTVKENLQFTRLLEIIMEEETAENKILELKELFEEKTLLKKIYMTTLLENQGLSLLGSLVGTYYIKKLEELLDNENKKKYADWHNIKHIVKVLIHLYKEAGEYEKSKALCNMALKKMFEENDVSILLPLLYDMADIKKKTEDDKNSYEDVFYIAELFELYDDSRRIRNTQIIYR